MKTRNKVFAWMISIFTIILIIDGYFLLAVAFLALVGFVIIKYDTYFGDCAYREYGGDSELGDYDDGTYYTPSCSSDRSFHGYCSHHGGIDDIDDSDVVCNDGTRSSY